MHDSQVRPDKTNAMSESPNLTVLFADVAGSTRLYERCGDKEALRRVGECLAVAKEAVLANDGEVIKTIGDELMCLFPNSGAATLAACAMQSGVHGLPQAGDAPMALRIGYQSGPVLRRDGDVFGDTVNVAARIVGMAASGQILLGDTACETLPSYLRFGLRTLGHAAVRGRATEVRLHEIVWDLAADLTVVGGTVALKSTPASPLLELRMGTLAWRVERGAITIGRDAANQVVLGTKRASRSHARIESRDGRFVLCDLSANGTFIQNGSGGFTRLCGEEATLTGTGTLTFGDRPDMEGAVEMRYTVTTSSQAG
jgi:adenylate cyclase